MHKNGLVDKPTRSAGKFPATAILPGLTGRMADFGFIAQLAEQRPFKAKVSGSSPLGATRGFLLKTALYAQWQEQVAKTTQFHTQHDISV